MEKLKYEIEDSTVAELLGVQNFTNKESAILEIVKNSFDAGATELKIKFQNSQIIIIDNGKGMNEEDIKKKWMHVGKSSKENEYSFFDENNNERILSGSKGIGRFALARLGKNIEVTSKTSIDDMIMWSTDWDSIKFITKESEIGNKGTKIVISDLRDKWNKGSIEKLKKYLSRTIKNFIMKVSVEFDGVVDILEEFFAKPKLGDNCLSIIEFKYSAIDKKLECIITSDEFSDEAKHYYNGEIKYHHEILDISSIFPEADTDIENILEEIGNFKGELYFGISSTQEDVEKFLYKHSKLINKYEGGVILYRNTFSISSYDGTKDWIGLGKRARKSPAAATHKTGKWRVKENNIAGKIEIDKSLNKELKDLSNRQGLEENIHYEVFLKILDIVLDNFESYRQEIIRDINSKNTLEETSEDEILKRIIKNSDEVLKLSLDERDELIIEILELQKREKSHKKNLEEAERTFKYDARILNVLSTAGLKATSIAHDMQNDRNMLLNLCENLKRALIKHGVWEILDKVENKKIIATNVPKMLTNNERINKKLVVFIGTLLQDVKKSQFSTENLNILKVMEGIKNVWERDYGILKIELIIDSDLYFKSSEDIFRVIFDNLILNSFQQNKNKNKINVKIKIEKIDNFLEVIYQDDGKGLKGVYEKKPLKILEVHETSRKDGHGLGMWITNNTIIKTSGKIKEIKNLSNEDENKNFYISFTLGSDE